MGASTALETSGAWPDGVHRTETLEDEVVEGVRL